MIITHDLAVVSDIADFVNVMYCGKVVERAEAEELFKNPLHPYTKGLLRAIPSIHKKKEKLQSIEGSVPNLINLKENCYFNDRCEEVMCKCKEKEPQEIDINGHKVSCFLYG